MNEAIEFLQNRLKEKEEMLNNRKPWHNIEEIQYAIDGIKSAILSYRNEAQVA